MISAVPPSFRFDSSMNGMLAKAHYIMHWHHIRYLRDCKGISHDEIAGRHLEDVPSIVPATAEKQYLQESRGLEEFESIAISALEMAEETPGDQQAFNIANSYTKLGKVARCRQDWDTAVSNLNEAIRRLDCIITATPTPFVVAARHELADACFLLGEVHMARYRRNNNGAIL